MEHENDLDSIADPMLRKIVEFGRSLPPPSHNVRDERRVELMLDRFMHVNGYLTQFDPEVNEQEITDEELAKEYAKESNVSKEDFFSQVDAFMRLTPFPMDIVEDYTNLYFKSDNERLNWLKRMIEITHKSYEEIANET